MIKKFNRIRNYRIFQNWQPDSGLSDFSKVNLLYGVNGSGKSTLCNLMADASEDIDWTSGLSLSIEETSGTIREVQSFDDSFWSRLRVFNRGYIQENLMFDAQDQSLANALLQLGKVNIDREKEIRVLNERIKEIELDLPGKELSLSQNVNKQEKLVKDSADLIGSKLRALEGRYRPRSYTAAQVKPLLKQTLLGVDDARLAENLEIINRQKFPLLVIPDVSSFSSKDISVRIREICNRTATSVIMTTLQENSHHAVWVQQGLGLHKQLDSCIFCANRFSNTRRNELNQHFSDSLKVLQGDIDAALNAVQVLRVNLSRIMDLIPDMTHLLPDLRQEFTINLAKVEGSRREFVERLAVFDQMLEAKKGQLFESINLSSMAKPDIFVELSDIIGVIQRHNAQVPLVENSKALRGTEVEHSLVLAIQVESELNERSAKILEWEISGLKKELTAKTERLGVLQNESGDPISLAEELNIELAEMLGRAELIFRFQKNGMYSIERNGIPATFLSEGEKSVISLLYFIKSLDAADCDRSNTIVMVDDPISSMDSNFTIGMSARIWASLVGKDGNDLRCKQLFLFTHNYDFFRSWCNYLDRLNEGVKNQQEITYLILEIRTRFKMGELVAAIREPYFLPWPTNRKLKQRIKSEYHYLFWRAAETLRKCKEEPSIENDLEAAAILPNSCRRLLEGFLSFRFPADIGYLRTQLSTAIDLVKDSAVRTRLLTFLHQYSHNEEPNTSKPIDRPESVRILSSVFELIKLVDEPHYQEMIKALDIEDSILVQNS